MTLRNFVLLAGLAAFLVGCVVAPRPYHSRAYDNRYDDGYYDYRNTPVYEGYYYVRIIFISNIPYYVHDDRHIRPIPPGLHDHFRGYPYAKLGRPVFSRDTGERDGYPMSRIVYLDDVPHHVTDDRIARPLPNHLHQYFRYTPPDLGSTPINGKRQQFPASRNDDRRNQLPALGRERDRNEPPANGQDRERTERSPFERKRELRDTGNNRAPFDQVPPSPERNDSRRTEIEPKQQEQRNADEPRSSAPLSGESSRNVDAPQENEGRNKKDADKKKSRERKDDLRGGGHGGKEKRRD